MLRTIAISAFIAVVGLVDARPGPVPLSMPAVFANAMGGPYSPVVLATVCLSVVNDSMKVSNKGFGGLV